MTHSPDTDEIITGTGTLPTTPSNSISIAMSGTLKHWAQTDLWGGPSQSAMAVLREQLRDAYV